jgi:hypothetical protein
MRTDNAMQQHKNDPTSWQSVAINQNSTSTASLTLSSDMRTSCIHTACRLTPRKYPHPVTSTPYPPNQPYPFHSPPPSPALHSLPSSIVLARPPFSPWGNQTCLRVWRGITGGTLSVHFSFALTLLCCIGVLARSLDDLSTWHMRIFPEPTKHNHWPTP